MNIQFKLTNKWLYSLFLVSAVFALAVGVWAYTSVPNPGHGGDRVIVSIEGQEMTLQEALDADAIGAEEGVDCVNKRGAALQGDQVLWCGADYSKLVHCGIADDSAPDTVPTEVGSNCLEDGACSTSSGDLERVDLGADFIYSEIVSKSPGIEGCLTYDHRHSHKSYKLDVVCCRPA